MGNKVTENTDYIESLDDTVIFNIEDEGQKEVNVIKEKNKVVDFTSPVEVLSEEEIEKKSKKKKEEKPAKKKKKLKIVSKIKTWWTGLSKKKKIITISIAAAVLIFIIALLIIFLGKGDNKKEKTPDVIVQEDNYIYKNGTLVFQDADKNEIGKYECKNKDEKKCYVAYQSNEDEFNGDIYLNEENEKLVLRSSIIDGNYVFIVDNKKGTNDDIILYSIKSKSNIDEYKLVKQSQVNKNFVILKDKHDKYGALDLSTEEPKTAISFSYDYAGLINSEMASKYISLKKDGKYHLADLTENGVSSNHENQIVDYNDNFVVTKSTDNKYEIFNYEGTNLQDNKKFLFVKIVGPYYMTLLDNGLLVYDKDGLKFNEVPIPLSSTNYNKTYILDANNQVISSEVAFEVEVNDENVTIIRGKATDILPIKEAQANKAQPFISYYSGILYIYSDDAKINLIGKYTCKNKNTTGYFDHCTIATSSAISNNDMTYDVQAGIMPILNNRFVFVRDSVTSGGYYLYDLSQSKKAGPYSEIEAIGLTDGAITNKNVNGAFIIAKNNKNQYGLLKINDSSVDFVLKFDYQELEKIGEYYQGKKSSGTYVLYDNSGKEVTKDVAGKIMSYNDNYMVSKQGGNYFLYKHDANKVDNYSYNFIKLENNYYVGISSDNTLGVYEYTNPGVNVMGQKIKIKASNDYKKGTMFKVSQTANGYIVKITDGENNNDYIQVQKQEEPGI